MANKIISNLTPKTSPAADDVLAIEDTEATKKIDYNALADAILNKLTSKTYSVAGSTQTLISAIDALNSNLMIVPNTAIELPANTTSFDAFDSVITSLGAFQGKIFEVQVSTGVNLDGVTITGGRKLCQIIRHSGVDHAAIYMFGWSGQDDRYFLTKTSGTWQCSKLPSRSEITALNNSLVNPYMVSTRCSDCDAPTKEWMYFDTSTLNTPASVYGLLHTFARDGGTSGSKWMWQEAFIANANMRTWSRYSADNGSTWSAWAERTPASLQFDKNNITSGNSTSFTLADRVNRYHYGLLIGGSGASAPYIAHVFIANSSLSYSVTVTPLVTSSISVSGTYDDSTGVITFTVNSGNAYGGLRYIDLQ